GMEIDPELIPEEETETEEGSVEVTAVEEKTEVIVKIEVPVAPETDLSSTIANAKSFVYTIDSDLQQGSGFLFNEKGDIVTNAHVAKDAAYITVTNSNGQQFNGHVIGISDKTDIALIRVLDLAGKQPMEMELSRVPVGTKVFAL
ncbi:trypsin-like peptidase domain-containing protein, partial [Microvirga sp. 3-52]|nr:trypsin-like peptidase domain-containing protein [Microvirga sp. 3-52]